MKRCLILALCFVLFLSLLPPVPAFAAGDIEINEENFTDDIFRNYVQESFDTDKNGRLSAGEIADATSINVQELGISSLKGVEFFTALKGLDCRNNQLTALNINKNTALTYLNCGNNQLTKLNVSRNTALKELWLNDNKITSLDVSKNTELTVLNCHINELKSIDVTRNKKLKRLIMEWNPIKKLDVSKNTKLEYLNCHGCQLTVLDISHNTTLTGLSCYTNKLKTLDLSKNKALERVLCDDNELTSLDVSNNPNIWWLRCYDNHIQNLNIGNNPKLLKAATEGTQGTMPYAGSCQGDCAVYILEVESSESGVFVLETDAATALSFVAKPKITTQPKAASVKAGKKVTFKVKAQGEGLKYQWYYQKPGTTKWVKIKNAAKAAYSFKARKKYNGYKYRCTVRNAGGKVNSKAVKLKVK